MFEFLSLSVTAHLHHYICCKHPSGPCQGNAWGKGIPNFYPLLITIKCFVAMRVSVSYSEQPGLCTCGCSVAGSTESDPAPTESDWGLS